MFRSLPQLETFYWVARLGSFHAAATRLHVTQPSVSIRIKELEADAGCLLLARVGRAPELTEQGRVMFDYVERILSLLGDLEGRVRSDKNLSGLLRLGVPDSFAQVALSKIIKMLGYKHPNLKVAVSVENSGILAQRLGMGLLDAAILAQPVSVASLQLLTLGHQALSWVASPSTGLSARRLAPLDLKEFQILTNPAPSPGFSVVMDWFASSGVTPPKLSTCSSLSAVKEVIAAGDGIGILPTCWVRPEVELGTLIELDVSPSLPTLAVFLVHPSGASGRPFLEVINTIREVVLASDAILNSPTLAPAAGYSAR